MMTSGDWQQKLSNWNYRCSMCGCESAELAKGHLNPTVAATSDNIEPICSSCNNYTSKDFILEVVGGKVRIVGLLNDRLIKVSPVAGQIAILKKLGSMKEHRQLFDSFRQEGVR